MVIKLHLKEEGGELSQFMTNAALQEPLFQENRPSAVGEILKAARLAQNLTLEHIAKKLCINLRQLSSLEENDEYLVCDVYTIGFVRLYAEYLDLNAQELIQKFKDQVTHHPKATPLIFPAPLPGRGMPSRAILVVSFLALVALGIGWWWMDSSSPRSLAEISLQKNIASEVLPDVKEVAQPAALVEKAPPTNAPAVVPQKVDLHVREEAWIEVKDQEGNIIVNKIFHPGETFEFKDSENLFLTTGNLKGTHLSSGDKVFPVSAKSGEVGRNIPLNPEKWGNNH